MSDAADSKWARAYASEIAEVQTVAGPVTYDGVWLDPVCGNYLSAEKALLDATKELD